jgi:hypothetical protein
MSSDKIIEILKEKPSLSSRQIYDILREDSQYTESYRTLQSRLTKMHKDRLLQTHSIGREIYYMVYSSGTLTTQDYFMAKIWNELFQLHGNIGESNQPEFNFFKLRGLVLMLPAKVQEELKPTFDIVLKRIKSQDDACKVLYADLDQPPSAYDAVAYNVNFMYELIGKVATALHKSFDSKE